MQENEISYQVTEKVGVIWRVHVKYDQNLYFINFYTLFNFIYAIYRQINFCLLKLLAKKIFDIFLKYNTEILFPSQVNFITFLKIKIVRAKQFYREILFCNYVPEKEKGNEKNNNTTSVQGIN